MSALPAGPPLPARDAYRLWARRYESETVVSALEARVVSGLLPALAGLDVLDAGCGTGRRLDRDAPDARLAVGADLVPEMLRSGAGTRRLRLCAADVRTLPFARAAFDVLWCRLVLGHLPEPGPAYVELRRVARSGARLIVSDFHPAAAAAGHRRTFRDGDGRLREVAHHVHDLGAHQAAAVASGWSLESAVDAAPGPEERPFYERAGRLKEYDEQRRLPLVLALRFVC